MFGRPDKLLKIVSAGDPVLRQRARALSEDEIRSREIQDLIRNMRATMRRAPGVGLAAPQVGESLRLFVLEDQEAFQRKLSPEQLARFERKVVPFQVVINPVLTIEEDGPREFFEGCLSVGEFRALVPRARAVKVTGLDENVQPVEIHAVGWHARIMQHEYDHLEGMLCLDRMVARTFMTTENHARFWADKSADEVRRALGVIPVDQG